MSSAEEVLMRHARRLFSVLAIVLLIGTLQTTTFDGASVDQASTDRCPLLDVNGTNITIFDVY